MSARYQWVKVDDKPRRRKSQKAKAGRTTRQDKTMLRVKRFYRNAITAGKIALVTVCVMTAFWYFYVR